MLGDTATQEEVTADNASSHDLSDSDKEAGLQDVNETKGDAHDELLKDIATQEDVTTDDTAERAAKEKPATPGEGQEG